MSTLSAIRSFLYALARFLGDVNAVRRGRVGQRIGRRIAGRIAGRGIGRLFRSLIPCVLFLQASCVRTDNSQAGREAEFEFKTKCASYNAEVQARLAFSPGAARSNFLDSIFYSPVLNTCVLGYSASWNDPELAVEYGIDYVLDDALTRERIFFANTKKDSSAQGGFEAKKAELKALR